MEPIKQEIINNIFENGDKLITGPILQTVLIDMIDDVNVKDQEILSKTGSWDDAVTQIPNLATKEEVTNLSESVARDLANVSVPEGVATEAWVQSQGYLTEHQDISGLATKTELTEAKDTLQGNITSLSESVARDLANVDVDLTGYATETWVQNQGYLTEHQDISNLATKSELTSVSESVQTDITNLSESVANSAVWKKGTGTDSIVQKLTGDNEAKTPTASGLAAVATGLSTEASGEASHAEGQNTNASGNYSHAEGRYTTASGMYSHAEGIRSRAENPHSHAEGFWTVASADYSHAEGGNTYTRGQFSHAEGYFAEAKGRTSHAEGSKSLASGQASHAEGFFTVASNDYEHAQGKYNHNSTNQIFSVGAGEKIGETVTRRNAVSILEVPNSDTQVVTASVFVQNIGGYDGTNPEPGTNDLATVINNLPSGGGSSETLWKKGTGEDSIAQVITTDNIYIQPNASGTGSIATGFYTEASGAYSHAEGYSTNALGENSHAEGRSTTASGSYSHAEGTGTKASGDFGSHAEGRDTEASGDFGSHAEGWGTNASGEASHAEGWNTVASGNNSHAEGISTKAVGSYSHAEGWNTVASGLYSHAEGDHTVASNSHEHAQGMYNHTSSNQIFSVGAGESIKDPDTQVVTETRRNAISVLAVRNNDSYASSFFVQNIGGYDGTNPEPGTNDLATVINGLSSSGGTGTSTETWTFTLEDGSTVTKNIVMR